MNTRQSMAWHGEAGFTLIEALVAMVVLTIGVLALYTMQVVAIRGNSTGNSISTAANISSEQVEQLINRAFTDGDWLVDKNGDGTKQDLNKDGKDDNGGNFGLDNVEAAADYTHPNPDNHYTVSYNVAVDVPLPGTKLVQVNVRDNAQRMNNTVKFQYIKNAAM